MKKYLQVIGISAIAAGLLYYPAMKLYRYIKNKKDNKGTDHEDHHVRTFFGPAYRGKHKPHHRTAHNGHSNPDLA